MGNVRAGKFNLRVDGALMEAYGNFTYGPSFDQAEEIPGIGRLNGFKETYKPGFIEGEITDNISLDLTALVNTRDATVTLELRNGKTFTLQEASYTGDGTVQTENANIKVKFTGLRGEET